MKPTVASKGRPRKDPPRKPTHGKVLDEFPHSGVPALRPSMNSERCGRHGSRHARELTDVGRASAGTGSATKIDTPGWGNNPPPPPGLLGGQHGLSMACSVFVSAIIAPGGWTVCISAKAFGRVLHDARST